MSGHFNDAGFVPLNIAVLTISDTRTEETDKSGLILKERAEEAGHNVVEKAIVKDDIYEMRATFSRVRPRRRSSRTSTRSAESRSTDRARRMAPGASAASITTQVWTMEGRTPRPDTRFFVADGGRNPA